MTDQFLVHKKRLKDCMGFEKYRYSVCLSDDLVRLIDQRFGIISQSVFAGTVKTIRTKRYWIQGNVSKNSLTCVFRSRSNTHHDILEFEALLQTTT